MPQTQPATSEPHRAQPPTTRRRRQAAGARRSGYAFALVINAALLYGLDVWPGWERLPAVTADVAQVVGLCNAALLAAIVVNLVYLVWDPLVVVAAGAVVTTTIGLLVLVRLWRVFPFAFTTTAFDAELVARVVLAFLAIATAVGLAVQTGQLVAAVARTIRGDIGTHQLR